MQPVLRDDDRDALILQTRQDPDERLRAAASRLDVGSSSTRILGRHAMAAASATRCFCPLDSSVSLSGRSLPTPQSSATMRTRATVAFGAAPLVLEREGDLVSDNPHEELASRVLHHHAHALGPLPGRKVEHVRSVDEDGALPLPGKKVPASPSIRRRTVDLPSPDLPQMTVHEPYATSSDTPQTRPPAPDDARSCPASSDSSR